VILPSWTLSISGPASWAAAAAVPLRFYGTPEIN